METEEIANYRLVSDRTRSIHDVYFDTVDQSLSRHRLNLRLRQLENKWRLTLKKSPGIFTRNRNLREETELEWSAANWDRILGEISRQGVKLTQSNSGSAYDEARPIESLLARGLVIVQDRETLRRQIGIVSVQGELWAELAVDTVTYHFRSGTVSLDELEIEAKSQSGHAALREITDAILDRYAPELQRWKMGKLRTGARIEKLLESGRLKGLLDKQGRLSPEAYDLIAKG